MSDGDQISCKVCRRQFAKYTCPSCNLPYCSLSCFRSSAHSQCSESFYKKELETDIRISPSKSMEEKSRMMELLKKFEEENTDLDHLSEDESGDEGYTADLAERLENVDLDIADTDTLWSLLSAEERSKFLSAMGDPSSDLAQQLLNSEELERDKHQPWWEASAIEEEGTSSREIEPVLIPLSMVKPSSDSETLVYNMCAICIAYAFTIRHFAISSLSGISPNEPDHGGAVRLISRLVPFLTESKSTTCFTTLSDVIVDIWPRFDKGQVTSRTFALLLGDCVNLLKPLLIAPTSIQGATSAINPRYHPHYTPILALSDLSNLFSRTGIATGPGKRRKNHITQKLLYYAAQIYSTPSHMLHLLSSELSTNAHIMHQEQRSVELRCLTTDMEASRTLGLTL